MLTLACPRAGFPPPMPRRPNEPMPNPNDANNATANERMRITKAGKVDVYSKSQTGTWELHTELTDSITSSYSNFGYSVAVYDDIIAIGVTGTNDHGPHSGKVILYQYESNKWNKINEFLSSTAKPYQWFGNTFKAWAFIS